MAAKVSILMSVYNPNWDYLKQTLDSIVNQTFKDYELVIVNDGADETKLSQLLNNYDFDKIVVRNPVNLGLPRSLNLGLKKCSGIYIARIDDDDLMEPDRLLTQYEFMERDESVLALFSNYLLVDENGKVIGSKNTDQNRGLINYLNYRGNCLCHSTLFVRSNELKKLKGYDEKMTYAQDYDLYLRMIKEGPLYVLQEPLVRFRCASNRISKNKRILSALYAYYASLKNMDKYNCGVFWSRTIVTVRQLKRIICS